MIKTKKDLQYYMACDKIALRIPKERKSPRSIDITWKYEILLRKTEYYCNRTDIFGKIMSLLYRYRLIRMSNKTTIFIPVNVFGPGLSIAHNACIVVNSAAHVGKNCRIHEGVTIGATNGSPEAPEIGDNCFLGSGAKIIGKIKIGNNVAIGAGAVVVKSIDENGVSIAGVPAKVVSQNGSGKNVVRATEILSEFEKVQL